MRYDATSLRGRDRDVARLRALLDRRARGLDHRARAASARRGSPTSSRATPREPVVHVVELVGVTTAEDVVGEVGSVLGVRDSVSAQRTLTPEQRLDVRSRIAQRLAQGPSLLVLDNCEHVIDAAAELVAFLVSATADLRVLTTSRAPLEIGAEHVYLLGELEPADAAALFCDRALAARPDAELPEELVRSIVTRLDGLPLAIELAAAKVRAMSVEEIDRRLEDRFALLRGGDRAAPDRHQTLLAVIDWSWNLLDEAERRALRRLALFNDGFTLEAADAVLGDGALDAVQGLVDQSLLSIRDAAGGVRYRMLETVREFGRLQLEEAGEGGEARAARRAWATAYADRHRDGLFGRDQFATIDAIAAEEINLADELRDALADGDRGALVELLAVLGTFWTIRGEHARLIAVTAAIADAVRDWQPPPELEDTARAALAIDAGQRDGHRGPAQRADPRPAGAPGPGRRRPAARRDWSRCCSSTTRRIRPRSPPRLEQLAERSRPPRRAARAPVARPRARERRRPRGGGRGGRGRAGARRSATRGRGSAAILRTNLADLTMNLGDTAAAGGARPRRAAGDGAAGGDGRRASSCARCSSSARSPRGGSRTPRPSSSDSTRSTTAGPSSAGSPSGRSAPPSSRWPAATSRPGCASTGSARRRWRALRLPGIEPTGMEPWGVLGESIALAAHAYHGTTEADDAYAGERVRDQPRARPAPARPGEPASRLPRRRPGAVRARRLGPAARRDARRTTRSSCSSLAERFAYNRMIPTMAWERIAPDAEARAPGRIAALRDEPRRPDGRPSCSTRRTAWSSGFRG